MIKTEGKYLDIVARFYNSIIFFCVCLLSDHFSIRPGRFHREIFELLKQAYKYSCVVAPRGHTKSTTVTLGYALWCILFKQANFIVIISDTYTQSKYFLDAIKKELETNDLIRFLFGDLTGEVWSEGEIETKNGVRLICKGAGQKIRGLKWKQHRPDLVIVDDLENEELTENKDRRIKLEKWFFGSVVPALAKDGRMVVVGTILHYDSLLNKISRNPLFKTLFYKAIIDEKPLWEDRYTIEDLKKIKENYRSQGLLDTFYCEYMNEPISDENAIFKKSYFKHYTDDEALIKSLSKFITVDLAISEKESADYTVIMVCGVDAIGNIYVLEYLRDRYTPIETMEWIFKMVDKWQPYKVGIEGVAYQKALQWFIQEEMRRRNKYFIIEELKADTDKQRRIRGLQPRYALGTVYHKAHHTELEEELLLFPKSPFDDISDALAYVPQIAFPGEGSQDINLPESGRRDAMTYESDNSYTNY